MNMVGPAVDNGVIFTFGTYKCGFLEVLIDGLFYEWVSGQIKILVFAGFIT